MFQRVFLWFVCSGGWGVGVLISWVFPPVGCSLFCMTRKMVQVLVGKDNVTCLNVEIPVL